MSKIKVKETRWVTTNKHPVFKVGMSADSVRLIARRSHRDVQRKPEILQRKGKHIEKIKWFFQDAQITLKHNGQLFVVYRIEVPANSRFLNDD